MRSMNTGFIKGEERGSAMTEYSVILALLNVALVVTLTILSASTAQPFTEVAQCLHDAGVGATEYGGGSCSTMVPPEASRP